MTASTNRSTRTAAVVAFVDRVGETTPIMVAAELRIDRDRAAVALAYATEQGRLTRTSRGRYVRAQCALERNDDTAAEVIRRGDCTPGCLTAGSAPTGCTCPCGGTLHGHLAEIPVDVSGATR